MKRSDLEISLYKLLNGNTGGVPVFRQDTRDPDYVGDYVEIIPLVFDDENIMADSSVNVNVHVPELDKELKTLTGLTRSAQTFIKYSDRIKMSLASIPRLSDNSHFQSLIMST